MEKTVRIAGRIALIPFLLSFTTSDLHFAQSRTPVHTAERTVTAEKAFGSLPMSFEVNKGQFDPQFKFVSYGTHYALLVNSTGATLKLRNTGVSHSAAVRMNLVGANPSATVTGVEQLPGTANYMHGTPENWITHVPTYEKVLAENVYPGVDVAYYGNQGRLEYDFILKPGASPEIIDVAFEGASKIALSVDGDLVLSIAGQEIRQPKPVVYQESGEHRSLVESKYILRGGDRVGFEIAQYERTKALVIDPQLVYSIYGQGYPHVDAIYGVAVDSIGNAYICGTTFDGFNDNMEDAYVEKINPSGTAVLWQASFGAGGTSDIAEAIAVDASSNAYVVGSTGSARGSLPASDFPTVHPIQPNPSYRDPGNAFITKFDTSGNMVYSTTFGGSNGDGASGIAVDSLGNMFVAGGTGSADFPKSKPFQGSLSGQSDAFVTVLNAQGSEFIYSTYIGGSGNDRAMGIALDAAANIYVTGVTDSGDFPLATPIDSNPAHHLFTLKLNAAGSALHYSTYFGGTGTDVATGIAVDSTGSAYIVGTTNSQDFTISSAFQPRLAGSRDAFVTKINSGGTAFSYSTYLGGSGDEAGNGIAVNASGNAYVIGTTFSQDFPQIRTISNFTGSDAFVTELMADGSSLVYSTLLGGMYTKQAGRAFNLGNAIALDSSSNAYVAGLTNAWDFPTTANPAGFQGQPGPTFSHGEVSFIARLMDDPPATNWTRVEETSSAIQYTGTWSGNASTLAHHSGGSAKLALDAGARATFTFNGTAARWIAYRDEWSGIAKVYVDGAFQAQLDTYASPNQAQAVMYTTPTLTSGTHTLTVEVLDQMSASAQAAWIWVDAFDYMAGGTNGSGSSGNGCRIAH